MRKINFNIITTPMLNKQTKKDVRGHILFIFINVQYLFHCYNPKGKITNIRSICCYMYSNRSSKLN